MTRLTGAVVLVLIALVLVAASLYLILSSPSEPVWMRVVFYAVSALLMLIALLVFLALVTCAAYAALSEWEKWRPKF